MSSTPTFSAMSAAVHALQLLAADHPDLPAPSVGISNVFPGTLELSFHLAPGPGLSGFDAWCTALGITNEPITSHVHIPSGVAWRTVSVPFADAQLTLLGYFDPPAEEVTT